MENPNKMLTRGIHHSTKFVLIYLYKHMLILSDIHPINTR